MADAEQLVRIRGSVKGWNAWREKYPDARVDLSGADLQAADLRGASLQRANLSGAKLNGAESCLRKSFEAADFTA